MQEIRTEVQSFIKVRNEKMVASRESAEQALKDNDFITAGNASIAAAASVTVLDKLETIIKIIDKFHEDGFDDKYIVTRIRNFLISEMAQGANDRWSGRTNDIARVINDEVLVAFSMVQSSLNDF